MKFGLLLEKALASGINFDFFATGHYVRVEIDSKTNRYILKKAADYQKDQTYFLYGLKQEQLRNTIFPLGNYLKNEVKEIALTAGLKDFADKNESQDFVEGNDYSGFFSEAESQHGSIVDSEGNILGRHFGIINYTIGQRKGLNLGGAKEPFYVIGIDSCKNQIIVGTKSQLYTKKFIVKNLNWISIEFLDQKMDVYVKTRAHSTEVECTIIPFGNEYVEVILKDPQSAIAPGQSAVFYDGEIVVGGGIIQGGLK